VDYNQIEAAEALTRLGEFDALIDVRSPGEFALDHIPGALNCPVLDDRERALIGAQYTQESPFAARRDGAVLVARNIARLIDEGFHDKPRDWKPLVYCWRGGQRSAALTHVLNRVGWKARQIKGGYREYRRFVLAALAELPPRFQYRVICGTTGSGKSRLLHALAEAGAQTLDLEALARHRGSVLGQMSEPQPTQKRFESLLWQQLRGLDERRPVFIESESRKVGDLRVPDALIARMRASPCLRLELPLAERIRLLREEYRDLESDQARLFRQLDCLVSAHGAATVDAWKALAQRQQWSALVERLLHDHYDPVYQRSIGRNFNGADAATSIRMARGDSADFAAAARRLILEIAGI
jgi:tRNA 2-selenouridine synthase